MPDILSHPNCPFCDYQGPSEILWKSHTSYVVNPLRQITPGHVLVIPFMHVRDFVQNPQTTGEVFRDAARYWREWRTEKAEANLITSKGKLATQSVMHLHVHVVPRRMEDGLALPWEDPHGDG